MATLYAGDRMVATRTSHNIDPGFVEDSQPATGARRDLAHLSGPAAEIRQVLAAHFVRDCPHVVEIGGHLRPVTAYLTHRPKSVLVVDPKTVPHEANELNGHACRVRHIARKFQEVDFDYAPRSYGFVMLGYSLKPSGRKAALGDPLLSLIDDARIVVIDYAVTLERAVSQVPHILDRKGIHMICNLEMVLDDTEMRDSPYARRKLTVFRMED